MSVFGDFFKTRAQRGRELEAELAGHLSMDMQARIARGESPDAARTNAQHDFGSTVTVREVTTDMWSGETMHLIIQDFRHAIRSLSRVPGFTLIAILTLALGIGANTAIFSVINGVILRPLPLPKPEQLVFITSQFPGLGFNQFWVDGAELLEFRERNQSFQNVGGYATGAVNVGTDVSPQRVASANVSAGFFEAMGASPAQGRAFSAEETFPNSPLVAILSYELWQTAFGGHPVVGKQLQIDGVPRTVVGVMPPAFDVHDQNIKIWLPLRLDPAQRAQYRGGHYIYMVGRLKEGVSLERARAELETLLANWPATDGVVPNALPGAAGFIHTPNTKLHRLRYDALQADMIGSIGKALWILQAAVVFVLLIACANLANLLLMRAETRHKELALRAALGAGRGRLIRLFMSESLVISISGAIAGSALAFIGLRVLVAAGSESIPRAGAVTMDGRVFAFTMILGVACGLVFGLAPMLHLSTESLGIALREAGSRTTGIAARNKLRRGLVITEMALAVMLVIGAGLLLRSFWNMMNVDAGFDRANLSTFSIALPTRVYTDSMRRVAFFDNLVAQISAIPGVQSAAAMSGLPPRRQVNANDTQFEGFTPKPNGIGPQANIDYVQYASPTYFAAMKIPIVEGRGFGPSDGPLSPPVLLINETTARMYYPKQSALGKRIKPNGDTLWHTVIGVAKDVKQGGVDSKTGTELYLDYQQTPRTEGFGPDNMNVVIRSTLDKAALATATRRIVDAIDPTLPIVQFRRMDEVFAESAARPRFLANLLGVFATVALLLSAIGTYGVLAYTVTERRREIGIRMALGASAKGVLVMVLRQGLTLAVIGLAIGLVAAAALTRVMSTLLFGVKPTDPITFIVVGLFMLIVAAAASIIPARRATRVDPLVALRAD
jgi:putative ABC transport system permease protein